MGCLLEFVADIILEKVACAYIELMSLIVPEHKLSHKAERTIRVAVFGFTLILFLAMVSGIVLILQPNQNLKIAGYYLTFIPLAITVIQTVTGVIVRTKRKRQEVNIKSPGAFNQSELAEIMYNKQISFVPEIEVVDVFYSLDKLKRFIVIKNDKHLYSYCYEFVELLDEEEYNYMCTCYGSSSGILPANWITRDSGSTSFYDNLETVMKEIHSSWEYNKYFVKED